MSKLLCWLGIHKARTDFVCFAWEPVTDWIDRWYCCEKCGERMEYVECPPPAA